MDEFQLTTPVAFIVFNRPDTTERVFAEIARAKPPKLLVVGDGPRPNRPGEIEKVAGVRSILERIDWDCEVLTNFSDVNLGCKQRVSSGIDWIFEQVEEAIILEDDCFPHPTFFRFCEEMLARYRNDQRISQVNGTNYHFGYRINDDSYYFSNYSHIWGWATWRNRWENDYDVELNCWPRIRDERRIDDWFCSSIEQKYWTYIFESVYFGEIDTWDYQWFLACRLGGRLSVVPNVNLISNIGYRSDATHTTKRSLSSNMPLQEMSFPLAFPEFMFACQRLDRLFFDSHCKMSIHKRAKALLRQLLRSAKHK